jgi:general secretion pathway protein G
VNKLASAARRREGFTLVEMMVVIVIIGILATVVIVNISGKADRAKMEATSAIIKQLGQQMELFKLDNNRYPENLMDLYKQPSYVDPKKWPSGGYVTEPPVDGWGRDLLLRIPGPDNTPFDIMSLGEDNREGGEGAAADITFRKRPK